MNVKPLLRLEKITPQVFKYDADAPRKFPEKCRPIKLEPVLVPRAEVSNLTILNVSFVK